MNVFVFLLVAFVAYRVWQAMQAKSRPRPPGAETLAQRVERLREWDGESALTTAPPERRLAAPLVALPGPDENESPEIIGWPSEVVRMAEAPAAARRAQRPPPAAMRLTMPGPRESRDAATLAFPIQTRPAPPAIEAPVPAPVAISRAVAAAAAARAVAPVASPRPAAQPVAAPAPHPAPVGIPSPALAAIPERAPAVSRLAKAPAEAFEETPAVASAGKVGGGAMRTEMRRSTLGKAPATPTPDPVAPRGRAKG